VPGFDAQTLAPLRVVVDSRLRTPPDAALLAPPGRCLVATLDAGTAAAGRLRAAGAEVLELPADGARVDLGALLDELGRRAVNELLVEAGATLSGALLARGLVDELWVYVAATLLGDNARPLLVLPPLESMAERPQLAWRDVRRVGGDLRLIARPVACNAPGETGDS
jgi:diaminohydroxyphosphoribosylaminopyrimidine deaminase/5-amino-6-(5-phosphoribosylamino)uracil reductase